MLFSDRVRCFHQNTSKIKKTVRVKKFEISKITSLSKHDYLLVMMYDNRDRVKTAKQICSKRSVSPVKILCHMSFDVRFSYCFLIMKYLNVFLILTLFNFKVRRRSNNFVKLGRLLRLKIH